jgi:hypothetical protein
MIDLAQVSHALRGATERSLIILDEFGKGRLVITILRAMLIGVQVLPLQMELGC